MCCEIKTKTMKLIVFDLPAGFRVESNVRFKDGFSGVSSVSDYVGEHSLGLPSSSGDSLTIKITKL